MCLKICFKCIDASLYNCRVCINKGIYLTQLTIDSCEIAVDHVANITRPLESVNVLWLRTFDRRYTRQYGTCVQFFECGRLSWLTELYCEL